MGKKNLTAAFTHFLSSGPNAIASPFLQYQHNTLTKDLIALQMQLNHEERMAVLEIIKKSIEQGHIIADESLVYNLMLSQAPCTIPPFLLE